MLSSLSIPKTMNKISFRIVILFLNVLIFFFSCKSSSNPVLPEDKPVTYNTLFKDTSYANGFNVSSTNEANPNIQGRLNYGGSVTAAPVWEIGQWNCINNDLLTAKYSYVNNQHEYRVGTSGNRIAVNTVDGTLTLELNASTEYGLNGITSNPRKENEPWPTLLCQYTLSDTRILKISDKRKFE